MEKERGHREEREEDEVRKFLEWEAWQEEIYLSCSIKKRKKIFLAHPSHSFDFLHFLPLFALSLCIIDELDQRVEKPSIILSMPHILV